MLSAHTIFRFAHRWIVEGELSEAFDLVSDPRTFGKWFPLFKQVELSSPTGQITPGACCTCMVRASLPYAVRWHVEVTGIQPNELTTFCRLNLWGLRMAGTVRYTFSQQGKQVVIDNNQVLVADRGFPRPIHAILQRLFAWNHRQAMRRGGIGLGRLLARMNRARQPQLSAA